MWQEKDRKSKAEEAAQEQRRPPRAIRQDQGDPHGLQGQEGQGVQHVMGVGVLHELVKPDVAF